MKIYPRETQREKNDTQRPEERGRVRHRSLDQQNKKQKT
jgi:hypothetical protein